MLLYYLAGIMSCYIKWIKSFLLPLIFISSCDFKGNQSAKNITGTWRLYKMETGVKDQKTDPLLQQAKDNQALQEGLIVSFFEDGNYTLLAGDNDYQAGTYKYIEEHNKLILKAKKNDSFSVSFMPVNKLPGMLISMTGTGSMHFLQESEPLNSYKQDPFYPVNNTWRIKPDSPENRVEITNRLAGYIGHLAYVLKAATERKQQVVSFENSKGLVRIYSGGIGILPIDYVPQSWKDCYYDEADAKTAYIIYEDCIEKTKYRGASTGNWVEDDYQILTTIYGQLKL